MADLGIESAHLEDIGIGQLLARIDRSWDTRREIRGKIGSQLPGLKSRAARTNELVVALLRERVAAPREEEAGHPAAPH